MVIQTDGNVGIGTTASADILALDSSSNTRLLLREAGGNKGSIAAGGSGLYIRNLAGTWYSGTSLTTDTIRFKNNGTMW